MAGSSFYWKLSGITGQESCDVLELAPAQIDEFADCRDEFRSKPRRLVLVDAGKKPVGEVPDSLLEIELGTLAGAEIRSFARH